ncbi:hypothetical protein [Amaricoccus sp.]|uniref:hypothetical protein n=1 Tax=Amaricoccus sp. TaxID=1872485 RepID=UPI001B5B7796|nr:hypothetical protein [Amaricoccus sp.]MBP7000938.1 hypothetical protein [Amaricoccus sp.]
MVVSGRSIAGLLLYGLLAGTSFAAATEDPALTLRRRAEVYALTIDELDALPQATIVTENEFSDGPVAYRGPLIRDVIALLALFEFDTLRFTAANDYYIDIPTEDFERYDVIVATEANGVRLSRRDKGPLWLMYPISGNAELDAPEYTERLIWQLVEIEAP